MSRRVEAFSCALLFIAVAFVQSVPTAVGRSQQPENNPADAGSVHPVLLELFTSEGCSSCPPADVIIQKLDTYQPIAGAQLIVLSEHVTYWDHDGWKDPNSLAALTDRQTVYATELGVKEGPYTPQLVVDGSAQALGSDPQQIEKVLEQAKTAPKVPVRISEVTVDSAKPPVLHARIETDANFDKHNAEVYVVVALDHVESQVLH